MRRVLSCVGPDARIEIYVPQADLSGAGIIHARTGTKFTGLYALDLSGAGKGKTLEPIHLRYSRDRKAVIVDQDTRKLEQQRDEAHWTLLSQILAAVGRR